MEWVFLAGGIASEMAGALSLRAAMAGRKTWYVVVAAGYLAAFGFLSLALNEGLGLGIAYGIWAAAGVALTAIASKFLFQEPLTRLMAAGIALIVVGVILIETGGAN